MDESKYNKIVSVDPFLTYPEKTPVHIQFIALLKSISYEFDTIIIELTNLDNSNKKNFETKINCKNIHARRNAQLAISLLCRFFEIDLPPFDNTDSWCISDIYMKKICFIHFFGVYLSKDDNYIIFVDDLEPISVKDLYSITCNYFQLPSPSWRYKSIFEIFLRLLELHRNNSSLFNLDNVENYNSKLRDCVILISQNTKTKEKKNLVRNETIKLPVSIVPIYKGIDTIASQNEFDSQMMDTQLPETETNQYPFTKIPITQINELIEKPPLLKKQKLNVHSLQWSPKEFAFSELNEERSIEAILVASDCTTKEGYSRLYFVPKDTNLKTETSLLPYQNCLVVLSPPLIGRSIDRYATVKIDIKFEKLKLNWNKGYSKTDWILKTFTQMKTSLPFKDPPPIEKWVQWKDLLVTQENVQYVRIVAVLIAASFENWKYVALDFTDFTSNTYNDNSFINSQFLDKEYFLPTTDGFRVLIYPNKFANFESKIESIFNGKKIRDLTGPNSENISDKGIVCQILIKAQIFNGRLNLIARECIPLTRTKIIKRDWYNCEPALDNLHKLYSKTFDVCSNHFTGFVTGKGFQQYSKFFPFIKDTSEHHGIRLSIPMNEKVVDSIKPESIGYSKPVYDIQSLNADISTFEIYDTTDDFTKLNSMKINEAALYRINSVKLINYEISDQLLILYVTNNLISHDLTDPTRIIELYIIGKNNIEYFTTNNGSDLDFELEKLVGNQFDFMIKRSKLPIRDHNCALSVWCPIECTLEGLKCFLKQNAIVNSLDPSYGSMSGISVKLENMF